MFPFFVYLNMITLRKGETSESIFLTLTESLTLADPIISIIFKNVNTLEEVSFDIQLSVDDLSQYPQRYNEINVNTSVLMANKPIGQYVYRAVENGTSVILEQGKLTYFDIIGTPFKENNPSTTYKAYNG